MYLTVRELATILKVPKGTVYYWISRNEIPYISIGKHKRFDLQEVLSFFKEQTEQAKISCAKRFLAVKMKDQNAL